VSNTKKMFSSAITVIIFLFSIFSLYYNSQAYASTIHITVNTNKQTYYSQENVEVSGILTADGQPLSDNIVGLQANKPSGTAIALRTVATGPALSENWPLTILEVTPTDANDNPKSTFNPGSFAYFDVKIGSNENHTITAYAGINVYDGRLFPLGVWSTSAPISAGNTMLFRVELAWIPPWAHTGSAIAYATVYDTNSPQDHGYPLCPEKNATFTISHYSSDPPAQILKTSSTTYSTQDPGQYMASFRVYGVPKPQTGIYKVYASSYHQGELAFAQKQFNVEPATFPPQASFFYLPPEPYVNMTITFDASASTPENGTITSYIWNFGDGSPEVVETDTTTTHIFKNDGRFIVTLNVTDSEGLWSTTAKPIDILPPTGPTADFSYSPGAPWVNGTTTFDGSSSILGWNGTGYTPIDSYEWNFGDGNQTSTTTATITHVYTAEGNYTVSLVVIDKNGLSDSTSKVVPVSLTSGLIGDVNGDGTVDIFDLVIVSAAFGSNPGEPSWDARADINGDGTVDIFDLVIVSSHFGESTT